jgi:hypothetical protein
MILKMNFNFNFKDMLGLEEASIRDRTMGRDWDHTVGMGD